MTAKLISKELKQLANPENKKNLQRFFKTGPGEYGEGDIFLGLKVPQVRKIVGQYYKDIDLNETKKLITSKYHEERMTGLLILVKKYPRADDKTKQAIFKLYTTHTKHINNWDLVDLTAHHIVGVHLYNKDNKLLFTFAKSKDLWKKRIAIIATFYNIRQNEFKDALKIAKILLHDEHDLIHKAVGWMLREVGNRDLKTEEAFLIPVYKTMPRTMLRYAIEKFEENKRQAYLKGLV